MATNSSTEKGLKIPLLTSHLPRIYLQVIRMQVFEETLQDASSSFSHFPAWISLTLL